MFLTLTDEEGIQLKSRNNERNTKPEITILDILRGLTIILMIIVNTPGSWSYVYPPLLHAEWNGITPTDYIFPTFLFIVGVSIVLSFTKQIEIGKSKVDMTKKNFNSGLKDLRCWNFFVDLA